MADETEEQELDVEELEHEIIQNLKNGRGNSRERVKNKVKEVVEEDVGPEA